MGTKTPVGRLHAAKLRPPNPMTITISNLQPVIAIVAGVLILIAPRLLNYIVAAYLIVVGLIGLGLFRGLV